MKYSFEKNWFGDLNIKIKRNCEAGGSGSEELKKCPPPSMPCPHPDRKKNRSKSILIANLNWNVQYCPVNNVDLWFITFSFFYIVNRLSQSSQTS